MMVLYWWKAGLKSSSPAPTAASLVLLLAATDRKSNLSGREEERLRSPEVSCSPGDSW